MREALARVVRGNTAPVPDEPDGDLTHDLAHDVPDHPDATQSDEPDAERWAHVELPDDDPGGDLSYDLAHDVPRAPER